MNYEELLSDLQPDMKKMKDQTKALATQSSTAAKQADEGNLKALQDALNASQRYAENLQAVIASLKAKLEGFDATEYFQSGEFATQMLEICEQKHMDVVNEAPVYQMFPSKVTIQPSGDVILDKKKVPTARPLTLVTKIQKNQEKLLKERFNAVKFRQELVDAYDLILLKKNKRKGSEIALKDLYMTMTPMARARKEYDLQAFAFDVARLYGAHIEGLPDGRTMELGGSARNKVDPVRYLDNNGAEHLMYTMCITGDKITPEKK